MMLPTLISVSLAPGSYFFCAIAGPATARLLTAMETNTARLFTRIAASFPFLLFPKSETSDLALQDRAERLERLALELPHLHVLDRIEVRRTGIDLDAGQRHARVEVFQARGLLHHAGAREIIAALLEHLHHRARHAVAVDRETRALVALGIVLVHEGDPFLAAGIVVPERIGRVLAIERGENAPRILAPRRFNPRADR